VGGSKLASLHGMRLEMDMPRLNGSALMEVGIWSRNFCRQWCGCGKQHVQSRL